MHTIVLVLYLKAGIILASFFVYFFTFCPLKICIFQKLFVLLQRIIGPEPSRFYAGKLRAHCHS